MTAFRTFLCALVAVGGFASGAAAATCGNNAGGFNRWLQQFSREAAAAGIPNRVVAASLNGVSYDSEVIRLDRRQGHFRMSFERFYATRVSPQHVSRGRSLIRQNASLFRRIEQRYGVPAPILVAIWGLETSFGGNTGNKSVMRSLATLAYDCRRSQFFTEQLMAAMQIVQRGDMSPAQMRGAWAGEIGQTQFLATSYIRFAVDFDGNGRRDLIRSSADALASTANYLRAYGWRPGQSWAPGSHNYAVLREWNRAAVYQQTISTLASQIAGS